MRAPAYWRRRGVTALSLAPLAALYRAVTGLRRRLYQTRLCASVQVGVPVVVVGNLVAGGGGKTPLVISLVHALAARGWRPGVISRGYGGTARNAVQVHAASSPAEVGDEACLIHARTGVPTVVGRDRVAAARRLLAGNPGIDVIVSDDGLQHYRLARTVELCVIDSTYGLGNGCLLPAGPLREPASRLASVDALMLGGETAVDLPGQHWRVRRVLRQVRQVSQPGVNRPLAELPRAGWLAVCGIARPEAFFAMLDAQGFAYTARAFPDHHAFRADELPRDAAVLMTEKDAVKCTHFAGPQWWAVELEAILPAGFGDWLVARLQTAGERRNAR